jgi:hypothetical protein
MLTNFSAQLVGGREDNGDGIYRQGASRVAGRPIQKSGGGRSRQP